MTNQTDSEKPRVFSKFETEMQVRPDDIDMNEHVHNSTYFDYVLAARYDQMERCYKMSIREFIDHGYGWVVKSANVEYKRPLGLGDHFVVRTWIKELHSDGVQVHFEIIKKDNQKLCCDGYFNYTMINAKTGRAEKIPDWIVKKYTI